MAEFSIINLNEIADYIADRIKKSFSGDNLVPVEVIRCKDCIHLLTQGKCRDIWYSCAVFHRETLLDDYCSHGERREENENAE